MQRESELTIHAGLRSWERATPASIVVELQLHGDRLVGHETNGRRVEFRVIRHGQTFWIAPVRDGCLVTIYQVAESEMLSWSRKRMHNPDQTCYRFLRLPQHVTPDEAVTQELANLWLKA